MLGVLSFPPGKLKGARASGVCCLVCAVPWPGAGDRGRAAGRAQGCASCEPPPLKPQDTTKHSISSECSLPTALNIPGTGHIAGTQYALAVSKEGWVSFLVLEAQGSSWPP